MASEAVTRVGGGPGPGGGAGAPQGPQPGSYSPVKREPIAVRSARINHCVLGVNGSLRSHNSPADQSATQTKNLINRCDFVLRYSLL